jgi:hypothetical protein
MPWKILKRSTAILPGQKKSTIRKSEFIVERLVTAAEAGRDDALVLPQRGAVALDGDVARLQHVAAVGQLDGPLTFCSTSRMVVSGSLRLLIYAGLKINRDLKGLQDVGDFRWWPWK